jgi:hypothetical protein
VTLSNGPLTEAELFGVTGTPVDIHRAVLGLQGQVDAIARELVAIREVVELLAAVADLDPGDELAVRAEP